MEKEGVIVFGGSAGSIEVIINLFPLVPADFPIPIVVVLHRKNTSEHHLEDVLSRKSKVPVLEIQDKTKIIPGNIYIAPGDYHVLVDNDKTLALDTSEKVNFSRPSIDVAFEEFARVYGSKCIGILLSGANSDGSSGLKRIKDAGGLTIVQSPDSAKVATMPMSAVKLFQPDVIANPQQMAGLLIEASKFPIGDFIRKIKNGEDLTSNLPSILLVDDLDDNLFSLNAILKSEGYLIDKARSGEEALEKAKLTIYDCIVLDVQMPEMDGFEVAKRLSKNIQTESIPILFLSALGSDKEKVLQGLEAGAVDFIGKPPDPLILKAKIRNCVSQSIRAKEKNKKLNVLNSKFESLQNYTGDVSASFRYAQNIQQAILPNNQSVSQGFKDNFIIFQPKESIGGDFYYFKNLGTKIIFGVGDCTGHGAPGAMMSMMSVNILNNIIVKRSITQPKDILKAMTMDFISTFQNENNSAIIQDGLEISICLYDLSQEKLFYSGAGGRVFVYENKDLKKIRGTSDGISGTSSSDLIFEEHEFDTGNGLKLYLLSDGILDQFGGEKGKKYLSSRLEKSILTCVDEPMTKQEIYFRETLKNWMGGWKQIDDITLLGFSL